MSMLMMAVAMSVSGQSADSVTAPRTRFDECLQQRVAAAKRAGETPDNFRKAVRTACAAEAAAFRTALIAYDRSTGQSQAEAESWADQDIADHRDAAARRYER
ncbi:hypothetical protein WJS89_05360 [Sphingomicrobium sp. XHP0235]|uniref:hypothetical protein n=1 Tax=Sphingomicrobium aquimarinum TaxID=3133971 RepID=UPI0031FE8EC7